MSFYEWRPYVSRAQRQRQAERELAGLRKKGKAVAPVTIEGRKIATSFWGLSWCANLERYSDYANRLPRGRSYVRNGCVLDLQIAKGEVVATVSGSRLYTVKAKIKMVAVTQWRAICRDCAGGVDSLVELLQGRLAQAVMDRVCREGDGLFPSPREIKLSCSCPDWADMCKHVAAVLYGIGARLDHEPQLLFVLRGVDANDFIAHVGEDLSSIPAAPSTAKVLDAGDVAALFGLEMADAAGPESSLSPTLAPAAKPPRRRAAAPGEKSARAANKGPVRNRVGKGNQSRRPRIKTTAKKKRKVRTVG
jgi:uncharacterized Zn finger protein